MPDQPPRATPLPLRIIHLAFMAAPLVYILVGYQVARAGAATALPSLVAPLLGVAAVSSVIAGYVVPRFYWRQVAAGRQPGAERGSPAAYQTGMIITWACFEAVAIYGLVLTIMSGQWHYGLAGSVASLAFLASARPQVTRTTRQRNHTPGGPPGDPG